MNNLRHWIKREWTKHDRTARGGWLQGMGFGPTVCTMMLALFALGCESAPPVDDLPLATCQCTDGVCPPDRCGLQLEVAASSCSGEVSKVEVLLAGAVDPEILRPGQKTRTCLTLARGETATFFARSDGVWQWQETITCPAAVAGEAQGPILARVLNCTSN